MKIRVATPEDAGALVEIYRPYVENTSITFEYEVPSVSEFETRIRTTLKNTPTLWQRKMEKLWDMPMFPPLRAWLPTTGRWKPLFT